MKKGWTIAIICVAVVAVILVLCLVFGKTSTESDDANVPTATWLTYENSDYGVTINYSSDWQKNESIPLSVITFIYYPEQNDLSSAALGIMVYDSQSTALEKYTRLSLDQLEQDIPNYNQIEATSTVLAGNPAEKVVYTGEISQNSLKFMQIWTIKNNKVYLISYAAPVQLYSDSLSTVQKMIDSFEIA